MQGLMQHHPLTISSVIEFAATYHGDTGGGHRAAWKAIFTAQLRHHQPPRPSRSPTRLMQMAIARSARVATLAGNGYRHFELYYGVSGSAGVAHAQSAPASENWRGSSTTPRTKCFAST